MLVESRDAVPEQVTRWALDALDVIDADRCPPLLLLWSLTSALLRCLSLAAPFLLLLAIASLLAHN